MFHKKPRNNFAEPGIEHLHSSEETLISEPLPLQQVVARKEPGKSTECRWLLRANANASWQWNKLKMNIALN